MSLEDALRANQERIERMHRCVAGRTALVVIDMQRGFLDPGAALEVPEGREIVPNVRRLIEACRAKDVPVMFTEFVYSPDVPCLRGEPFGPEHLPPIKGRPTGFGYPSGNCLIGPVATEGPDSAETVPELATLWPELQEACFAVWRRKFARLRTSAEMLQELKEL